MLRLVVAYLSERKLATALNVLMVAIAVALLSVLLVFSTQVNTRFTQDAKGVDLVVGAKGSPLQLILSSIVHIDQPTGNIPFDSIQLLRRDPAVARVIPIALGDNFRGFRIVGTEPSFLDLQQASLREGRLNKASHEAIIGADVARRTGAAIGQKFAGSHGLSEEGEAHTHQPFEVVGILQPTGRVVDRLIVTSVETVWDVHGIAHQHQDEAHQHQSKSGHDSHDHLHAHSDVQKAPGRGTLQERAALRAEVTALLVTYRNASAAVRVPAMINRQTEMQAAVPAVEISRLLSLIGASVEGARIFGWLMAGVAGLGIFVALLAAAQSRAGDLALLRVMGARRMFVFGVIVAEALAIALIGLALGFALASALLWLAAANFSTLSDMGFNPIQFDPGLGLIAVGVVLISLFAALMPAARVYGADVLKALN